MAEYHDVSLFLLYSDKTKNFKGILIGSQSLNFQLHQTGIITYMEV